MSISTFLKNIVRLYKEDCGPPNQAAVNDTFNITDALQNPRRGSVVDWPYTPVPQPGPLMFQNPSVFLQHGELLENSTESDKSPFMTEHLNKYRNEFISLAMGYLHSSHVIGDYHEYGCYSASTFRMALTHANLFDLTSSNSNLMFHAFDSFEGLPNISDNLAPQSSWIEGSMAMSETEFRTLIKEHDVFQDRVKTYPGFYSESLTIELQKEFLETEKKISFVNIDCDLYESAVDVFNFIAPLIQTGTMIYIDDWYCGYKGSQSAGVAKAFFEFCDNYDVKVDRFRDCGWWGRAYTVL